MFRHDDFKNTKFYPGVGIYFQHSQILLGKDIKFTNLCGFKHNDAVPTILDYNDQDKLKKMFDLNEKFYSRTESCNRRCTLKSVGCIKVKNSWNLNLDKTLIRGKQNTVSGFNETVCIECIDSTNKKHIIDNQVFVQLSANKTIYNYKKQVDELK